MINQARFSTRSLLVVLVLSLAACGKKNNGGGDKLGIAECDAYLQKMETCAKKVGGKTGEQLTKMRGMMADAWRKDAGNKDVRDSMPSVCSSAIEDMKKQVPSCEW